MKSLFLFSFKKSCKLGSYHLRDYTQVRKRKWESEVFASNHLLTPEGIEVPANKHLMKHPLIFTLISSHNHLKCQRLQSHTPGRHNILIVTPQHQPSVWKTQSTTSILTKTRSKVVISFFCNVTSNQVSTQHMQVVTKAVQMILYMYWSLNSIHSGKT